MNSFDLTREQQKRIQELSLKILEEFARLCNKYNLKYSLAYGTLLGAIRHNGFIPWDDDIDVCMPREDYNILKEVCKTELGSEFFYQSNDTDPEYYYLYDKIRLNDTIFKETFLCNRKIHHGVFIDIFPIDRIPDNPELFEAQFKRFHYYRNALQAKNINICARTGKKFWCALFLRLMFLFKSKKYLYTKANEYATLYNNANCKRMTNFLTPYKRKDIFEASCYSTYDSHIFEGSMYMIYSYYDKMLRQVYGDYMQMPPIEKRKTIHTVVELKL